MNLLRSYYFSILCLMFTFNMYAQNNDFNDNGLDQLWSNSANWSLGVVPNTTNTDQVRLPLTVESIVDLDLSIKKIQTTFATSGDVPLAGSGILTIDAGANNNNAIENVSNNDVAINFKGNLEINNSAGGFTLMRSTNGTLNSINFDDGSTLTLTTNLGTISAASPSFNFNGSIDGSGNLRFGPNTVNTFGSTSSNLNWTGEVVFLGNAQAIVNTADNNIFYDGFKIQVNGNGSSIEINGENVYSGNIVIGGGNTFTFQANKNLSGLGLVEFSDNGTLNLDIDPAVTNLTFTDNSAAEWNSGTLNITGYQEGVIRFGTDNTGLSLQQLSQITADNGGQDLMLDKDGYLINETTFNDFVFNGGDLLWSNSENWSKRVVPNTTNTEEVRLPLTVESLVDLDLSIKKIQTTFATGGDVPIAGTGTLTIDAGANNVYNIENVSNNDVGINFKGNLEINNSAGGFTLMRSLNGNSNAINFETGSTLTLTTSLGTISAASPLFNFNGSIEGSGNLRFGQNTVNTFGSSSSNPSWTGELVFLDNAQTIVNTADNNTFYDGLKIQINGNGSSIEINGENVYSGNIVISDGHTFTFEANKNLNGLGEIDFSNNGTLNLDINPAVTNLSFGDNSAAEWNSGTLNITGFQEGVIQFGTDESGLTDQQLSQITADNGGAELMLDSDGFLVNVDFTYTGGSWIPSDPTVNSTPTDNIFIKDGSFDLTTTLTANNLRVALGATLNITPTGVLDLSGDIINAGNFVFQSDNSGSGQLAEFSGKISGNITTERFIPAKRAFRYLASPVGGTTIAGSWQEQIHITGDQGATNGFDETQTNNPSMFTFDHTLENQDNDPWIPIPNTSDLLESGKPYAVLVRGERSLVDLTDNNYPASDVTLSATGDLHRGTYNVEISNFPDNFTLVGNPYQAVVNLNNLTYGADVNTNFVYHWDPMLNTIGDYVEIALPSGVPNPSSSDADEFLRPGQSVFIQNKNTGTDFSIAFSENDKDTGGSQTQVFSESTTAFLNMRLYTTADYNGGQSELDSAGLRFMPSGNNNIDQMDAAKMFNSGVNLSVYNGTTPIGIENRALPVNGEQIQLYINNLVTENYTFRFNNQNMPDNIKAYLTDAYTNAQHEIETGVNILNFDTDIAISETNSPFRFSVSFEDTTLNINEFDTETSVEVYPNPTSGLLYVQSRKIENQELNIEIIDVLGKTVNKFYRFGNEGASIQVNTSELQQGIYFIKILTSNGERINEKFIKS